MRRLEALLERFDKQRDDLFGALKDARAVQTAKARAQQAIHMADRVDRFANKLIDTLEDIVSRAYFDAERAEEKAE